MHIDLTSDQRRLQLELREYFEALMTPERRATLRGGEAGGPAYREVVRELGRDGKLGLGWPREYGGQGFTALEQYLFYDEANRAGVPLPLVTLNTVGPTLMRFGSDAQKQQFLPAILAGEVHFAIGYSEPGAGTDLAALTTRAVRDGDEYVIDGQKIWTTGGHDADWVWLACRTDPDAPKHKGISIILVPTSSHGFSHSPIWVLGGGHTNATFYSGVRVPVDHVVLGENEGWKLITSQLNHERVALAPAGRLAGPYHQVHTWARTTTLADGTRPIDRDWVRITLARVHATVEALKLANWRVAADLDADALAPADASAMKVFASEQQWQCLDRLMEIVGAFAYLVDGPEIDGVRLSLEQAYRSAVTITFGGGVNEVQREIIGMTGLGLPRAPR
ncbi:MAG: acyl-CoA dehydrogenase [Actinobacteria bacterium]|nr:acyl-CoA dehydrogenase [Actinomycetota bacterium]